MSKSMNMLRTRRRDNNVKPNRKLDRKSSRGMIYENEELRLKTININAEVERGQSDIKKLKRENEMLKKEMWCLRDAYDKLDKMIKEKEISFSSSSTTCSTSETESCSTCSSDSNEVETSQNLENVQKTNLKGLHLEFNHLSVVPEENSTENSDKNSIPNETADWPDERDVIKPDQSYPSFETLARQRQAPAEEPAAAPRHFFSPLKLSKSCDGSLNNEFAGADQFYGGPPFQPGGYPRQTYPQNLCPPRPYDGGGLGSMHPISKSSTDLIVKMDNRHFAANTMTSSSFSTGGNLEELLNDIESISQDILKLSDPTLNYNGDQQQPFLQGFVPSDVAVQPSYDLENVETNQQTGKPYKSELNVVLMPTPMPLIGFDKYRNIQNSSESLKAKSLDNVAQQELLSPAEKPEAFYQNDPISAGNSTEDPFYFGAGTNYFNRYNPDNYINSEIRDKNKKNETKPSPPEAKPGEQISGENDENAKIKPAKTERDDDKPKEPLKKPDKKPEKQPKLSIRRKVSIHFKGKKLKNKPDEKPATPKTPGEKRNIFDIRFDRRHELQKTPSVDSKKSNAERNSEPKTPCSECRGSERKPSVDKQAKTRKSQSLSPEKHVHVKEESKKQHKKHKKVDKLKNRRSTISNNEKFSNSAERFMRERSFSVCTDRSNVLGLGLGYNSAYSMYDDYLSERERTNSLSSCGTVKMRKMSNMSNFHVAGKIPWCGCWGNGCL